MRYLILIPLVALLPGCGLLEMWEAMPEPVKERAPGIVNAALRGDSVGAIMGSLDLVLVLAGLKGLQVGGKKVAAKVKTKLVNPEPAS